MKPIDLGYHTIQVERSFLEKLVRYEGKGIVFYLDGWQTVPNLFGKGEEKLTVDLHAKVMDDDV